MCVQLCMCFCTYIYLCVRVCVFGGPPFGPQHSSIESEYFVRGGQYWEVNPISLNHEELKMLGWRRWPCWGWSLWLAQLGRVIRISAGCNASDTYTDTWQKSPACTEHICFDFFPLFSSHLLSAHKEYPIVRAFDSILLIQSCWWNVNAVILDFCVFPPTIDNLIQ